jgi:hypothetical protein
MPTEVRREIAQDDIQRALAEVLGPTYRITATSESSFRVVHNVVIWATIRVSWQGGRTIFHIRPGGFLLVALLNTFYTVPKLRRALSRAFPHAA